MPRAKAADAAVELAVLNVCKDSSGRWRPGDDPRRPGAIRLRADCVEPWLAPRPDPMGETKTIAALIAAVDRLARTLQHGHRTLRRAP